MQSKQKINIIGAGIAGLSAGIYACLNGFDTTIFETNPHAGGVCTSWERKGFSVNGSIHWLIGSSPGSSIYDMWLQLGVIEDNTFHIHGSFAEYRDLEGRDVHFYTDVNRLEEHLLDIAPIDEKLILEFTKAIRTFSRMNYQVDKSFELFNVLDWSKFVLGNLPVVMAMNKYNDIKLKDFAQNFQSPVLKRLFESFWMPNMSMTFLIMQFAFANIGSAAYPLGGSGEFTAKLENRYRELGGKFEFEKRINKVLIENDKAIGLKTENGTEYSSDYVISACDGHTTLFKLIDQKYVDEKTSEAYKSLAIFPSLFFFTAGINRTFDEVPSSASGLNIPLIHPVEVGAFKYDRAFFQIYNFDPTVAPEGKTLITAMLETDFEFWKVLYDNNPDAYIKQRRFIRDVLIASLEAYFPEIGHQIVFSETATPITFEKWTGNHKGSYEGWLPTPESMKIRISTHFKGLENFYMAGHWVQPGGGMPPAASTGRDAIQLICKKEGLVFKTRKAKATVV